MSQDNKSQTGYKNPPKKTRFKKGQSGNPKGRPKGAKGLKSILEDILNQRVVITEGRKKREISKLEAMVMQMVNSAAKGDHRAQQQVLTLIQALFPKDDDTPTPAIGAAEGKTLNSILRKVEKLQKEKHNG